MQIKCKQCGKMNEDESKFCDECGVSFSNEVPVTKTSTGELIPVEQATALINKTNEKTKQVAKSAKKMWGKLSSEERIVVASASLGFLSFIMPWVNIVIGSFGDSEVKPLYGIAVALNYRIISLFPILMLVVIYLVQSSRKSTTIEKIKRARFYILFGGMGLVASLTIVSKIMMELYTGAGIWVGYTVSPTIGLLLFSISMIALVVGGFKMQGKLLDSIKG